MKLAGVWSAWERKKIAYKVLEENLGTLKCRYDENIKMDLKTYSIGLIWLRIGPVSGIF
jgi:hypothetical protein